MNSIEEYKKYKKDKKLKKMEQDYKTKIAKYKKKAKEDRDKAIKKVMSITKKELKAKYEKQLNKKIKRTTGIYENAKRKVLGKKALKKHMNPKKTFASYFNDLLVEMQKFARLRDSGKNGYGKCITCGKLVHRKKANGGHAITRAQRRSAIDERCISLQCCHCNIYLRGNYINYKINLDKKYGVGTYDELAAMKGPSKLSITDILELKDYYKKKNKELEAKKNK